MGAGVRAMVCRHRDLFGSFGSHPFRMQLSCDRDHRFGDILLAICAATLLNLCFQVIHRQTANEIIGVAYVEIVRCKKSSYPLFGDFISDFVQLILGETFMRFIELFKPLVSELHVALAGSLANPIGKITVVAVSSIKFRAARGHNHRDKDREGTCRSKEILLHVS